MHPTTPHQKRIIVWFSCGAASAVTTKLALAKYRDTHEVVIAYTDPGAEHPDNGRFMADCVRWFNQDIITLRSSKYVSTWDVWEKRRFLVGPMGALCTTELKKAVSWEFERAGDIQAQAFGYTAEEKDRADQFRRQNPDVRLVTPLIEAGLTKADCLGMLERAGIELPAMYRLGFNNNNCIGCPKGGMGYWNKIRRHFPDTFARMAKLERELGHTCIRDENGAVWLDELDPQRGSDAEPSIECSLLCHMAEKDMAA